MKTKRNKNFKFIFNLVSRESGFALPIVLGLGLVMILLGFTMVSRSNNDLVAGVQKKQTDRSRAAAEAGVTRIQQLINQNRTVAVYNLADWRDSTNSNVTAGTACTGGTSTISNIATQVSGNWQDLSTETDENRPQYRLLDYTYTPSASAYTPPGTGELKVVGKAGTAQTYITVNVPVEETGTVPFPFPGMWVNNSVSSGSTAANILAPCTGTASATLVSPYTLTRGNFEMPDPPSTPTTNIATINDPSGLTLPRLPGDAAYYNSTTGEYQYAVSTITGTFTMTPGYKVAIYLSGNISMTGGQKAILHKCNGVAGCSPTDARIYGLSPNGTLSLGGNASICDVFFFAPTYDVSLNGGGQAQGCGGGANNNGIYWVKSWSGGGQGNHTSIQQTSANWDEITAFINLTLPPKTAPLTNWSRYAAP